MVFSVNCFRSISLPSIISVNVFSVLRVFAFLPRRNSCCESRNGGMWLLVLNNVLYAVIRKFHGSGVCYNKLFHGSGVCYKIGLGLTGFGIFFSFLGLIFFFDKGLLAMGNILFVSGVSLTIGLKSTMQFFMKRSNFKGTISFGIGFFILILGWPILGMIVESYGFIVLFSGFWPTLAVFLQKIPVLGWLFQQPFVRSLLDRYRGRRVPV
ncbi:hypothetical protein JHK85_056053 [Glycine max]|nr:hypothetical protein JHK86_055082 [Glycine max]KAG4917772.1 hypothetical protein JHK85_056053 [Glycine max]